MVPVISIVGRSGSGKTTLIEKVIRELTRRGYRVGSVKHDAHGFEIDYEGKDSYRHKKAGSRTVVLSSKEKFAVIKDTDREWNVERLIESFLGDVDVAVTEGFKKSKLPKIEVVRRANSTEPVCSGDPALLAYASDLKRIKGRKPIYALDDYGGIADLIEEKIIKGHAAGSVSLVADGEAVALKPFIDDMLREAVLGMVRGLKGCSGAKEIELRVRDRKP